MRAAERLVVPGSLALAACGGDDDAKTADPEPSASATQPAVDPKEPACTFLTAKCNCAWRRWTCAG